MTIEKLRDADYYPGAVRTWYVITIGGDTDGIAFGDAEDAGRAFAIIQEGINLERVWSSGMTGVDYKKPRSASPEIKLEKRRALTVDDVNQLGLEGRYYNVRCDHHIIKEPAACGFQRCWQSATIRPYKGEEIPESWSIIDLDSSREVHTTEDLEPEDARFLATCPDCLKRIADDYEVGVDELMTKNILDARAFEKEAMERAK